MGDIISTAAIENFTGSLGRVDILIIAVAVLLLFVISWGNIIAMIVSTLCVLVLMLLSYYEMIGLAWSWLIVIGTGITMFLGYLFDLIKLIGAVCLKCLH